jgi:hypothetical protein
MKLTHWVAIRYRGPRDVAGWSTVGARLGSHPPKASPEVAPGTARATGGVAPRDGDNQPPLLRSGYSSGNLPWKGRAGRTKRGLIRRPTASGVIRGGTGVRCFGGNVGGNLA